MTPRFVPGQLVVTVEHASPRVPKALLGLGLPAKWMNGHHGWDPGAAVAGTALARAFRAPLHLGRWSRLVADLNRSERHPRVIPRQFSHGGRRLPANFALTPPLRAERLQHYWRPWRAAVGRDLDRAIEHHGFVLHVSVHSFVERLGGEERRNHFGLLYQPSRRRERDLADRLDRRLSAMGYRVRRNQPYTGLEDGHCMRLRVERGAATYLGMEIEMNQRWVRRPDGARRFAKSLVEAFGPEFP